MTRDMQLTKEKEMQDVSANILVDNILYPEGF